MRLLLGVSRKLNNFNSVIATPCKQHSHVAKLSPVTLGDFVACPMSHVLVALRLTKDAYKKSASSTNTFPALIFSSQAVLLYTISVGKL